MTPLVIREDRGGQTTLLLNRPEKLNALNVALFQDLDAHLADLETRSDEIGLIILRGAGRCFSAGHDLGDIAAGEELPRPNYQATVIERLSNMPQIVLSAVHGYCYTGALELALGADIIVAANSAKFADTHAKWALTPIWGMSQRLPRRVGLARATNLMLTCRTVAGAEAAQIGLADWCFDDDEFDAQLSNLAQDILANSWFSLRALKRLVRETDGLPLAAGLAHEVYRNAGVGPDMQARISAFSKK